GIDTRGCSIGLIIKRKKITFTCIPSGYAYFIQSIVSLTHYEIILKNVDIFQKVIIPVRDHFNPVFLTGLVYRGFHQFEICCPVFIGKNIKMVLVMTYTVFHSSFTLSKYPELSFRIVSFQDPVLTR